MRSKFSTRSPWTERLEIALTTEQKQRAFAVADEKQISVAALMRQALELMIFDNSAIGSEAEHVR